MVSGSFRPFLDVMRFCRCLRMKYTRPKITTQHREVITTETPITLESEVAGMTGVLIAEGELDLVTGCDVMGVPGTKAEGPN